MFDIVTPESEVAAVSASGHAPRRRATVVVIGTGFGGQATAISLRRRGRDDFVMLERRDFVGGTWRQNSYPGAAVDVQSPLYPIAAEPWPWKRMFATRSELEEYTDHTVAKYRLAERTVLGAEATGARWTGEEWEITTAAAFKAPTSEERSHDFLWRIRRAVPPPGYIGVFDRSHYEDVLIARVRNLAPAAEVERRYDAINEFEAELVAGGTTIVKCMLHISADTQRERLLQRLDRPDKYWKFNPADIDERRVWPDYRRAYEVALERTNTDAAPWHVVPSDRKWYRNLAIGMLLRDTLAEMAPTWPPPGFDVDEQRRRLLTEDPLT